LLLTLKYGFWTLDVQNELIQILMQFIVDLFLDDFAQLVGFGFVQFFLEPHDHIFDAVRVGDLAEMKAVLFGGRLDIDIAISKKSRNNSLDFRGHILDARQFQFAHRPVEKAFLLNVDYPLVGDDPDVKIIIHPDGEKSYPGKHGQQIFAERQKAARLVHPGKLRHKKRHNQITADQKNKQKKDDQKLRQDVEPVPPQNQQHFFAVFLAVKMEIGRWIHIFEFALLRTLGIFRPLWSRDAECLIGKTRNFCKFKN